MSYIVAPTIVATAGAADANSYATTAQATAYHEGHPWASVWAEASGLKQARALVTATRLLDAAIKWHGTVASSTQALAWPRCCAEDRQGRVYASTVIPTPVVEATCEFARQLLAADRTADRDSDTAGLSRLKAGPVELEFKQGSGGAKVLPDAVVLLLRGLGEVVAGSGQRRATVSLARA